VYVSRYPYGDTGTASAPSTSPRPKRKYLTPPWRWLLPDLQPLFDPDAYAEDLHGCWLWLGWINENGYGTFARCENGEVRLLLAHRYHYTRVRGAPPPRLVLDHLCAIKRCVNPWHLEAVSKRTNMRRFWANHYRGASFRQASLLIYTRWELNWCRRRWKRPPANVAHQRAAMARLWVTSKGWVPGRRKRQCR